jgi:hypothetical protein
MFQKETKEQVSWCNNDIMKVNVINNEDAWWNVVKRMNVVATKKCWCWKQQKKVIMMKKC